MATSTVENYLKTILLRTEGPDHMVPMGVLAEALDVVPGTVTTMVKSLAEQGLLDHQARQGVRLTEAGRRLALEVLRKHRLVETFLVRTLKMDWTEVHEEAEALEHAVSERVLARIDEFLGHPATDPHGDPIPDANGHLADDVPAATLLNCALNKPLRVTRITDQSTDFLAFVQKTGLKPGTRLRVLRREPASGVLHCEVRAGGEIALGLPEAAKIAVGAVS
jgi:DtxR family Mn-dependent transcriptional regulator